MSSVPPDLPEPIPPRQKPLPPRGRDRALSGAPGKSNRPVPPLPPPPAASAPDFAVNAPLASRGHDDLRPYEFEAAAQPTPHYALHLPTAPPLVRNHMFAWFLVLTIVGIALAFTIPFTLGVYFGNQDRQQFVEHQAVEHFQRALAYESETYIELAIAELNLALQYDPNYQPARQKLEQLKAASLVKSQAEPQDVAIAKQLYEGAQDALARQDWNNSIDLLEELRRVKSDYQTDQVSAQLVTAYVNAGKEALAANDVDLAKRRFDAALAIDPNHPEARTLADRALLYFHGVQAMGTDWGNAVLALAELYQRDPNFADVKQKLRDAHIGYGQVANKQGAFCIAARELNAAVALGADATTQAQADIADENCKQAILNPTPTATPTLEGFGMPIPITVTPDPFATPAPAISAQGIVYTPQVRVRQNAKCNGTGDIKGAVSDAQGKPLANIGVKIYNDYGYLPPYARTDLAGEYEIVLGSDKGVFHLVVLDDFGSNASAVLDVDYPGGNVQGCHIVVDWKRK
jgi:tetratricopeptide (TPR) repeat protein